jgi:tetratricopeptide (TPR) repeat protein
LELKTGTSDTQSRRHRRRAAGAVLIGLALVVSLIGLFRPRTAPGASSPDGLPAAGSRGTGPIPPPAFAGVPDWNWIEAERRARRAVGLAPDGADAHVRLGGLLIRLGRFDEGLNELERARKRDPASSEISDALAFGYYWARRYDRAVAAHRRTLKAAPRFTRARLGLAFAYLQQGKADEALAEGLAAVDPQTDSVEAAELGYIYAAAGKKDLALKIADRLAGRDGRAEALPDLAYSLGVICAALGQRDPAFAWFEKAYIGNSPAISVLKIDPRLDDLRGDPRYLDLVKRLKFPEN